MIYCEREPYYTNSREYFINNINPFDILYSDWMLKNYRTVAVSKLGSFSEVEYHWRFNSEQDRTFFILRWS